MASAVILPAVMRAEAITKKVEAFAPGIPDRSLRPVEGEPKLRHHPACPRQRLGRVSATEDDEILGIGDDVCSVDLPSLGAAPMP